MQNREQNPEQFPCLVNPQTGGDSLRPKTSPEALLTRAEAAVFIDRDLGRPLALSTLQKLCAIREGPPVAEYWGRRPLYSREGLKAWVEARAKQARSVTP
jgi:hypothetical protein